MFNKLMEKKSFFELSSNRRESYFIYTKNFGAEKLVATRRPTWTGPSVAMEIFLNQADVTATST
jgi:hypothetical protein